MTEEKKKSPREYPPLYEKAVPIVLGILVLVVIGLIVAAAGVVLGFVG